jgi:hypothetical protein
MLKRVVVAMLAGSGLAFVTLGAAGAVPQPLPKYWSAARCERTLLDRPRHLVKQVLCVPSSRPEGCRWTTGHRTRLYSEFTVLVRYRDAAVGWVFGQKKTVVGHLAAGVVRSFILATRAQPGLHPIAHDWGDAYVGRPPDFYEGHDHDLATNITSTRFRSFVAPIAAPLLQQASTINCSGR